MKKTTLFILIALLSLTLAHRAYALSWDNNNQSPWKKHFNGLDWDETYQNHMSDFFHPDKKGGFDLKDFFLGQGTPS